MKNRKAFLFISALMLLFFIDPLSLCFAGGEKKEEEPQPEQDKEGEDVESLISPEKPEQEDVSGIIKGKVLDERSSPLSGVEVTCLDGEGNTVASTVTDEEGQYEFRNIVKGEYSLQAVLSGVVPLLSVQPEEEVELPQAPAGLRLYETIGNNPSVSYIQARWDALSNVQTYQCELYQEKEKKPLSTYKDIKQNSCEFGNLKQDTEYRIRVYSKNSAGYSQSYAQGQIRTAKKIPFSPFGLAVLYAKNNRVDLIWNGFPLASLEGYVLQIKKQNAPYLYFSERGLTSDKSKVTVIESSENRSVTFTIHTVLENTTPLLDNAVPYSFRVFALNSEGQLSKPSTPVEGVILEDTIPPLPPHSVEYSFNPPDRIRVSWKSKDRDVEKYRVYYGIKRDELDERVETKKAVCELVMKGETLKAKQLFVAITSVDRAGNESSYPPLVQKTSLDGGIEVIEDIMFSERNVYGPFSIALENLSKSRKIDTQKEAAKKIEPSKYGFSLLMKKGFVVKKGENATLSGALKVPENSLIRVEAGGSLHINNARIGPERGRWGGIRYLNDSSGFVHNTVLSNAVTGIALVNSAKKVELKDVRVVGCMRAGIHIKNSSANISSLLLKECEIGLFIENSEVHILNSVFEKNRKGVLANSSAIRISKSRFIDNDVYGVRLYGGGVVEETIVKDNTAGILLEEGSGRSLVINSMIERNLLDGIIISTSNSEIKKCLVSGNGRHGIYVRKYANPAILENDIVNNGLYAVFGGGKVESCYVYANNGSIYVDDTGEKGSADNVYSSSSAGRIKQLYKVDYIKDLSPSPVLQ